MARQTGHDFTQDGSERAVTLGAAVQRILDDLRVGERPNEAALIEQFPGVAKDIPNLISALAAMPDLRERDQLDSPELGQQDSTIGDYKIVQEIGRGGMGVVYEALQLSLDRKVALKVLPFAAMLDQRALQRFRNEVTAAAQLNHPNIVDVYAVGCDRGVHHYAMRLVQGQTLTFVVEQLRARLEQDLPSPDSISKIASSEAALLPDGSGSDAPTQDVKSSSSIARAETESNTTSENPSSSNRTTRRRKSEAHFRSIAEFGAAIADALDHAHQHGVVHRDIKPSNLMIDTDGTAWVTDFGLAQVETGVGVTMTGDILGTARYMSPEQVLAKRIVLDHRTDIYSLGVTLYEVLTLQAPFEAEERPEMFRKITFEEPRSPRSIDRSIPVDLETIVLKCLEKNPADRYSTAQELADDLRSYLTDEPIAAKRLGVIHRAKKWTRRHQFLVASAVVVLMLLTAGSFVATAVVLREQGKTSDALTIAEANLREAESAKRDLRAAIDQYIEAVNTEDLLKEPRFKPVLRRMLARALEQYDEYIAAHAATANEETQAELANALFQTSLIHYLFGDMDEAVRAVRRSIDLLEPLARENADVPDYQALLTRSLNNLGRIYAQLGQHGSAEGAYVRAAQTQELLTRAHPDVLDYQANHAKYRSNLATHLKTTNQLLAAESQLNRSIEILDGLLEGQPEDPNLLGLYGNAFYNMSLVRIDQVRYPEAIVSANRAKDVFVQLRKLEPEDPDHSRMFVNCLQTLGAIFKNLNERGDARAYFEEALAIREKLAKQHPNRTDLQHHTTDLIGILAGMDSQDGNLEQALRGYERKLEWCRRLADQNPNVAEIQRNVGSCLNAIGLAYENYEQYDEAITAYERAIEWWGQLRVNFPNDKVARLYWAGTHVNLGHVMRENKAADYAGALVKYDLALAELDELMEMIPHPRMTIMYWRNAQWGRAQAFDGQEKWQSAIESWQSAVDVSTGQVAQLLRSQLAIAHVRSGNYKAAIEEVARVESREDFATDEGDSDEALFDSVRALGLATDAVLADGSLGETVQQEMVEDLISRSFGLLKRLANAGFFRDATLRDQLREDPEFARLWEDDRFDEFLDGISPDDQTDSARQTDNAAGNNDDG